MTILDPTDCIIDQGRALVWAIEELQAIESSDPFERILAELFREAYERCLCTIVADAPASTCEAILSARKEIQSGQVPAWLEKIDGPGVVLRSENGGNGRTHPTPSSHGKRRHRHMAEPARLRQGDPSTPAL